MHSLRALPLVLSSLAIIAGCSTTQSVSPPDVPVELRPPVGQLLQLEALATGFQIYECTQKPDSTFDWIFKAPEASLVSRSGQSLGKHYAGPTWESGDGSTVAAEVNARDPGPTASAIPWLLLAAKTNTGSSGIFSATKSIQRVATVGGIAPAEPCTSSNVKQVARVPYTATYYFYR